MAKKYGVEEAVLIDRLRIFSNIDRDSGLSTGLLLERDGRCSSGSPRRGRGRTSRSGTGDTSLASCGGS